ncbi:MAG: hypothetical protein AAGJ73_12575 [Pseudomonadota bacterium]
MAAALTGAPLTAAAQECAWEKAGWTPGAQNAAASRGPAQEVRLISIGLDETGGFAVRTETRPLLNLQIGQKAFRALIDDMLSAASEPDMSGNATPMDFTTDVDTLTVYHLAPSSWAWAERSRDRFFMKSHNRRGKRQAHNAFGPARLVPGRDDLMAVRFNADAAFRSCSYSYNLGAIVRQQFGDVILETPIIIDPEVGNGGHGND